MSSPTVTQELVLLRGASILHAETLLEIATLGDDGRWRTPEGAITDSIGIPHPAAKAIVKPDAARAHGGEVRLACGVEALQTFEDRVEISTAMGAEHFSHVICAAPPVVAAGLLRPIAAAAETVARIDRLEYQPIYTSYLQYPGHVGLPHAMLGLHQRCSQWLFDKGRIAGQHGLLAAVISAEGAHQELSRDQLAQKVITELREEFGIAGEPLWFKVIAEKRATFCCSPNLQRPSQHTPSPRLMLAGDYTAGDYPATLEGAVISGLKCAAALVQSSRPEVVNQAWSSKNLI